MLYIPEEDLPMPSRHETAITLLSNAGKCKSNSNEIPIRLTNVKYTESTRCGWGPGTMELSNSTAMSMRWLQPLWKWKYLYNVHHISMPGPAMIHIGTPPSRYACTRMLIEATQMSPRNRMDKETEVYLYSNKNGRTEATRTWSTLIKRALSERSQR